MGEKTVDFDEKTEVGGFNPERRHEKKKDNVGPMPTDDPHSKDKSDLQRVIKEKKAREDEYR